MQRIQVGGTKGGQARKEQMADEHGGDVHAAYAEMGQKVGWPRVPSFKQPLLLRQQFVMCPSENTMCQCCACCKLLHSDGSMYAARTASAALSRGPKQGS